MGALSADAHGLCETSIELEPVTCHGNVLGQAEQPADAAIRVRGGGVLVGRIAFQHRHLTGFAGVDQMVGNTGTDDAATNDDNIRTLIH